MPESQITDVRRTLGGVAIRLGEIAATLTAETANEPDSLKSAAEWIGSGRSAAMKEDWDAALADYRRAFALAAPARDEARYFELPSELPPTVLLLPGLVATTPLRTIVVVGYVAGLSPDEAVDEVKVGELSIPTTIGSAIVRYERAFRFTLELGDVTLDPGTTLEIPVPVTAQLTTGGIAQGELTLIIYARSQDRSEER
jgi:hypothetical protein